MSTIADYSVFTKAFLAANVDFSQLYTQEEGSRKAFAVVPMNLSTPLTTRGALNLDTWDHGDIKGHISCRDADGKFIGNIVRIQPGVRKGSIRLVAKVAVPVASGEDVADSPYNTFVLLRAGSPTNVDADFSTNVDLPIAVATISEGYMLHKHIANGNDPLDDVENANYVSFTINNLNGYTSVDFNPDAYATYDDVANALSRGIDGLHIAFDTASGDLKLLDKDGNVLDQANLPIKTDVIIADGEEGYKYVKTDVKQDIHAAKAWMPKDSTAWEAVEEAPYTMQKAALVVGQGAQGGSGRSFVPSSSTGESTGESYPISVVTYTIGTEQGGRYTLTRSSGTIGPETIPGDSWKGAGEPLLFKNIEFPVTNNNKVEFLVITYKGEPYLVYEFEQGCSASAFSNTSAWEPSVAGSIVESVTSEGSSTGEVLGIALVEQEGTKMYTFGEGVETTITSISNKPVKWFGKKGIPAGTSLKYGLEAFVWTVKDRKVKLDEPFFQKLNDSLLDLGFHEGDDIALGTNLATLAPAQGDSPLNRVDAEEYIHGKANKATREQEVDTQRANAKEELVAWNKQHPELTANRGQGTIIDSSGLDVRDGHITLGCGRIGKEGEFQKVNYGIQMKDRSSDQTIHGRSESLDFTISHNTGAVQFDGNGHAVKAYADGQATNLDSSTLLSIEAGSYISGAPTCLILAKVTHNSTSGDGPVMFTPVRMTAGFSVAPFYDASSGLRLTIHDYRDNIAAIRNPDGDPNEDTAIIEVQAIYTHRNAETVPAQQMHTYIGTWGYREHPECSFFCNKIEEWMTAVGLTLPKTDPDTGALIEADVKLYVVIRVY